MDLELMLKWTIVMTLGITIPLGIKIFYKIIIGDVVTQNVSITAGGDAFAAQEIHIHQGEDSSGKRRKALRVLKEANKGIIWAIEQSKNPRITNSPGSYITKLQDAFRVNVAHFTEADLKLIEPILGRIIDYRKTFSELEAPCAELSSVIDSLK